jgi:hypothetical protein
VRLSMSQMIKDLEQRKYWSFLNDRMKYMEV